MSFRERSKSATYTKMFFERITNEDFVGLTKVDAFAKKTNEDFVSLMKVDALQKKT